MEQLSAAERCDTSCIARITLVKRAMTTWRQPSELKNICEGSRNCWQLLALISSRKTAKFYDWPKKSSSFDSSKLHWVHQKNVQSPVTVTPFRRSARTQPTTCTRQRLKLLRPWSIWSTMLSSQARGTLRVSTARRCTTDWVRFTSLTSCATRKCRARSLTPDTSKTSRRLQSTPRILMQTHKIGEWPLI